ncbi:MULTISPECIES: DUF2848 family protein [unclassified Paenibacillus]|uniref:DUF2848 family protein n=1 Tax=unclassified Paenibacillus TaxID=185978 RepID=UPI0006D1F6A7|nr:MULTISPECIES: DUF2848 family protein [unclassified Paenibacillus]
MRTYPITIQEKDGSMTKKETVVQKVLVMGYMGRDIEKVHEHIHELAEIGVAPPPTIPALYPQDISVLTNEQTITVPGKETSGEVEYVVYHDGDDWLLTIGSDHTDRLLEKEDIAKSKAACPKPFITTFWRIKDVEDHWDQLVLRSWITDEGGRRLYQEHDLTALLPFSKLLEKLEEFGYTDISHTVFFSGTVPTLEGFVYGSKFEYEISDPVLGRSLRGEYSVITGG